MTACSCPTPDCCRANPTPDDTPGCRLARPRIDFDLVEENAAHIRNALRKLDPLDDDVRAAGEALGALIYLARKERS